MNGAVQGAATTTASTPVEAAPIRPPREARLPPTPWIEVPISYSPERLSAAASITSARIDTTTGDCSWKPHPIAAPPALAAIRITARARKVASTPPRKASPCARAARASCAWPASEAAFMDKTGNTQGIRLRIRPPRKAKATASGKLSPAPA